MTNRVGRGTRNVAVNWIEEERTTLGRIAMNQDLSMGALIRKLVVERLAQTHPAEAAHLMEARRQRVAIRLRITIPTPSC